LGLANEGIVEANYQLAKIVASGVLPSSISDDRKIIELLRISSAQGHLQSLRNLAYAYLNSNFNNMILKHEALVLMSISAILGNKKSQIDLFLLPKFLSLEGKILEKAFKTALKRLAHGYIIKCEKTEVKCNYVKQKVSFVEQINAQRILDENPNLTNIYIQSKFKQNLFSYSGFSKPVIERSHIKNLLSNEKAISRYQREKRETKAKGNAKSEQLLKYNKTIARSKVAKKIIETKIKQPSKELLDAAKQLIIKINTHRDINNQLNPEQLGLNIKLENK